MKNLFLLIALCVCVVGGIFVSTNIDMITMKTVIISILGLVGFVFLIIPMKWALRGVLIYVGFEGAFKVLADYTALIHVSTDILISLLCFKVVILTVLKRTAIPRGAPPLFILFVIHFGWLLVEFANPYAISLYSSLAAIKIYGTVVMLYFFGYYLTHSARDAKILMGLWVFIVAAHSFAAVYQSSIGPTSLTAIYSGYQTVLSRFKLPEFRPFGFGHAPGVPAAFIFLGSSFLAYFLIYSKKTWIKTICVITALSTLLVCQIRSALLKVIVAVMFFLIFRLSSYKKVDFKKAFRPIVAFAIMSIVIAVGTPRLIGYLQQKYLGNIFAVNRTLMLFDYDKTLTARSGMWGRLKEYAELVPLGAGLSRVGAAGGKFKYLIDKDEYFRGGFFTDNLWLATLVDLGIPGMVIFSLIALSIIFLGFRVQVRAPPNEIRIICAAILSALIAIYIGCYGSEAYLYNPEAVFFWTFSGVMIRLSEMAAKKKTV